MINFHKDQKGFTLVELLVVITVVAILSAGIISGMNPAKRFRQARDSQRQQIVGVAAQAMEVCYTSNGGSYTAPDNCVSFAELASKNYTKVDYTGYAIPGAPSGVDAFAISQTGGNGCVSSKLEEPASPVTYWKYTSVDGKTQSSATSC